MWKLEFEAEAGCRLHRYGVGIATHENLRYDKNTRKWNNICGTEEVQCKTLRAFKSHLRRHPELRGSKKVLWMNEYLGYDVTATWVE